MEDINATEKRLVTALQRRDQNDLSFASECGVSAAKCLLGELYKHMARAPHFELQGSARVEPWTSLLEKLLTG